MPSFDIVAKIRNLLSFGNNENKLKRRADEQPEYSALNKYRRVSNDFPKFINKPFEDDTPFIRPRKSDCMTMMAQGQSNANEYQHQKTRRSELNCKIPSRIILPYADVEYSDDDDDDNFFTTSRNIPSATRNSTMINGNSNSKYNHNSMEKSRRESKIINIPVLLTGRKSGPPPPLIQAKPGTLTSALIQNVPNLNPIKKTNNTSSSIYNNYNPSSYQHHTTAASEYSNINNLTSVNSNNVRKRNSIIGSYPKLQTSTTPVRSETIPIKQHTTTAATTAFNMKDRQGYYDLLSRLAPALYKPTSPVHGRRSLSQFRNDHRDASDDCQIIDPATRRRQRQQQIINLLDEDEQIKEIIDLSYEDLEIYSTQQSKLGSKSVSEDSKNDLPKVDPVNSLKYKLDLQPKLQPDWLENFTDRFIAKSQQLKKQIQEEEANVRQLSKETEDQERLIEKKFRNFIIETEVVILDESEPEEEEEFPELTTEQIATIKRAAFRGPSDEVLISKFNLHITRRDVNTLLGDTWLNDEVINFYMNLLMDRGEQRREEGLPRVYAMNTFFIPKLMQSGQSGVRRWTRKVDIFAHDIIPVPVHVGGVHWCMAIIHLKNKTIKYYDSMGTPNPRVLHALEQYLKEESLDKKNTSFDTSQFVKESVPDVPRQMNGSDCGVFSCMFAEYITRNKNITFSQAHMQYFREKMILEIVQGKLLL